MALCYSCIRSGSCWGCSSRSARRPSGAASPCHVCNGASGRCGGRCWWGPVGSWHAPLFVTPWGAAYRVGALLAILVQILFARSVSLVNSWLFNETNGSVFVAMVFHSAINAAIYVIIPLLILLGKAAAYAGFAPLLLFLVRDLVWLAAGVFLLVATKARLACRDTSEGGEKHPVPSGQTRHGVALPDALRCAPPSWCCIIALPAFYERPGSRVPADGELVNYVQAVARASAYTADVGVDPPPAADAFLTQPGARSLSPSLGPSGHTEGGRRDRGHEPGRRHGSPRRRREMRPGRPGTSPSSLKTWRGPRARRALGSRHWGARLLSSSPPPGRRGRMRPGVPSG
jgi:hypothetical protein